MPSTGDPCPKSGCLGHMTTYKSNAGTEYRIRYLKCNTCGHKPENNRMVIPLRFAPKKPRTKWIR